MGVARHRTHDARRTEPRAQPVDQMRQLDSMIVAREPGLHLVHALDHERRQPQHVVTEAGIGFVAATPQSARKTAV